MVRDKMQSLAINPIIGEQHVKSNDGGGNY